MHAQPPELVTLVMQISLIQQWGYLPTLMEDFLWPTVVHAPSLKNLIMTLAIQDTADREVTSHSDEGFH